MVKIVKITYEDFLKTKDSRYSRSVIMQIASKYLNCSPFDIEDIDWIYKRTFDIYLYDPMEDDTLPF